MTSRSVPTIVVLVFALPALSGCLGATPDEPARAGPGTGDDRDEPWGRALPDGIEGVRQVTTLGPDDGMDSGYQLTVEGDLAYVAAWNAGFYVVDVSTPEDPAIVAQLPDLFGHDVRILHYGDRTVAALAMSADGIALIDVTDPADPQVLETVLGEAGPGGTDGANVHNIAVLPGTHLIYNSRSVDTPGVDIVDASDPEDPTLVRSFDDLTCHDISFHVAADRAFCAGIRETQIWDIQDPRDPEIVSRIVNPAINIHHWAVPARNGSVLIIGDEFTGATGPWGQACWTGVDDPATGGTRTDPVGALWFYDISDPTTPRPVSYLGASELYDQVPPAPCTAHFGEVLEGRDKVVLGFLSGGTYLVGFGDLTAPRVLDHLDVGEVVDVNVHRGWAFGVGRGRGLDVYAFEGA